MFSGPLEQSRPWDAKAIVGPYRLLQRIWRVVVDEQTGPSHVSDDAVPDELNRLLHKTIAPSARATRRCGSTPRSPGSPS